MTDQPVVEVPSASAPATSNRAPWAVAAAASLVAVGALVAVAVLAVGGEPAATGGGIVEHPSSTPEGAVTLFAEAFADGDLDTAATAFATTSMVDGYSFAAYGEYVGAVMPNSWLPADGYRGIDLAARTGDVGNALASLTRSALMPEYGADRVYSLNDDSELSAEDFVEGLDPAGFEQISVVDITVFENPEGTKFAENQARTSAPWGADTARTAVVLFDTADGPAIVGLQVFQYGDSWLVWDLFGGIVGADSRALTPVEADEYDAMVSDIQASIADS